MQRALKLADQGVGCTSPNPLVGCVVVKDGAIIGEGWHALYGCAHAEVNAIRDALESTSVSQANTVADTMTSTLTDTLANTPTDTLANTLTNTPTDTRPLAGSVLYVTLEPCNHHGLTPPCTRAILDAGIKQVVYALADPNPKAAGGARYLREQGVEVLHGVLEEKARFQNRFFLHHFKHKRPFVIAKSATSLDGRIATRSGDSQWITGSESRQRAHELRQAVDAIIVGADTVIADNPSLTTRLPESLCEVKNIRHPRPVILDSTGRVPLSTTLLSGNSEHTRTIIATSAVMDKEHKETLESRGFDVIAVEPASSGLGVDPGLLLDALGQRGIQSVLLEGGASVQGSFRDARLIDEVWAFMAPILIGGVDAPAAYAAAGSDSLDQASHLHDVSVERLGSDVLVRGLVTRSPHTNSQKAR